MPTPTCHSAQSCRWKSEMNTHNTNPIAYTKVFMQTQRAPTHSNVNYVARVTEREVVAMMEAARTSLANAKSLVFDFDLLLKIVETCPVEGYDVGGDIDISAVIHVVGGDAYAICGSAEYLARELVAATEPGGSRVATRDRIAAVEEKFLYRHRSERGLYARQPTAHLSKPRQYYAPMFVVDGELAEQVVERFEPVLPIHEVAHSAQRAWQTYVVPIIRRDPSNRRALSVLNCMPKVAPLLVRVLDKSFRPNTNDIVGLSSDEAHACLLVDELTDRALVPLLPIDTIPYANFGYSDLTLTKLGKM